MSQLRNFLRNKIRYQRDRIRSGLRIRHERPWSEATWECTRDRDGAPIDDFRVSPRHSLHHGIRKGIRKLRKLRALEAERVELIRRSA